MFKGISTFIIFILLLGQSAAPAEEAQLERVENVLERILSKEGISIGGTFRSQFLDSRIGGNAIPDSVLSVESTEYTSVDFDIRGRPNTSTEGRIIFRMHQDWQNFFSDISNPIFARWISIDGSIERMFFYNVGDFRQKYSPLTLYAPELDFIYEPDIFSFERQEAMNEKFLGGNDRVLQGVNMNFNAEVEGIFNEFRLNLMGSRLRNTQTDLQDGNRAVAVIEAATVEKYVYGGNLDLRFLSGFRAGGTFLQMFDKQSTYNPPRRDVDPDTALQNTKIVSLRAGVDARHFSTIPDWIKGLHVEYAISSDEDNSIDTVAGDTVFSENSVSAAAMDISLELEYAEKEAFDVKAKVSFIRNGRDFRNEMAQSPTFIPRRIMNVEAGGKNQSFFGDDPLYATSDATRYHVFKFTPSGETNRWHQAPFEKIAYTNSILTREELATVVLDTALQLVMPYGPATPNRQGLRFNLSAGALENALEAQVHYAGYNEPENALVQRPDTSVELDAKKFSQMGLGIKVDVDKFLGKGRTFDASISFQRSTMNSPRKDMVLGAATLTLSPKMEVTSNLIMAGLTYNFWRQASLLAGLQTINTASDYAGLAADSTNTLVETAGTAERNQTAWTAGVEYRISHGAYLLGTLGRLNVKYKDSGAAVDVSEKNFHQMFTNIAMRVHF